MNEKECRMSVDELSLANIRIYSNGISYNFKFKCLIKGDFLQLQQSMVNVSDVFFQTPFLTMSGFKRTNIWSEDFTTVLTGSRKCLRRLRAEISIP